MLVDLRGSVRPRLPTSVYLGLVATRPEGLIEHRDRRPQRPLLLCIGLCVLSYGLIHSDSIRAPRLRRMNEARNLISPE